MNWTLYKSKIQFEISKVLKNHWIYLLKIRDLATWKNSCSSKLIEQVSVYKMATPGALTVVKIARKQSVNGSCAVSQRAADPRSKGCDPRKKKKKAESGPEEPFSTITRKSGLSSGQYCDLLRGHADDGVQGTLPRTLQTLRILRRRQNGHLRSRRQKQTAR